MTERYSLQSEIGRGGMGLVWRARDEETGSIVAIKLLRDVYAEDPDYIRRFEREAQLAQRIDSVHVVKVLDFGLRDKVPYLALEYVDGPSLHDALTAHGTYGWPETRAFLAQLAQGLADANAAGVIHRDIKPSNVLIAPDGMAKLTDFGIARGLNFSRITATSTIVGTPAYLAPEGPKDARSDLYSLGIIGYELLTGAVPFKGTTYQEVVIAHIREAPDLSILPEEAQPVIAWLLAKDPAERPQRASALLPVLYGAERVPEAKKAGAALASVAAQPHPTKPAAPGQGAVAPAPTGAAPTPPQNIDLMPTHVLSAQIMPTQVMARTVVTQTTSVRRPGMPPPPSAEGPLAVASADRSPIRSRGSGPSMKTMIGVLLAIGLVSLVGRLVFAGGKAESAATQAANTKPLVATTTPHDAAWASVVASGQSSAQASAHASAQASAVASAEATAYAAGSASPTTVVTPRPVVVPARTPAPAPTPQPLAYIRGRITDENGAPLAGIDVLPQGPDAPNTGESGSDGTYSVAVGPGQYGLIIDDEVAFKRASPVYWTPQGIAIDRSRAATFKVPPGGVSGIDIKLPLGYQITGTLTPPPGTQLLKTFGVACSTSDGQCSDGGPTYGGQWGTSWVPAGTYVIRFTTSFPDGTTKESWWSPSGITTDRGAATPIAIDSSAVTGIDGQLPWGG